MRYNDRRHWLENIQTTLGSNVIQALEYSRYENRLVHERTTSTERREFVYDELNRLRDTIDFPPGGGTGAGTPYRYDVEPTLLISTIFCPEVAGGQPPFCIRIWTRTQRQSLI